MCTETFTVTYLQEHKLAWPRCAWAAEWLNEPRCIHTPAHGSAVTEEHTVRAQQLG